MGTSSFFTCSFPPARVSRMGDGQHLRPDFRHYRLAAIEHPGYRRLEDMGQFCQSRLHNILDHLRRHIQEIPVGCLQNRFHIAIIRTLPHSGGFIYEFFTR